MKYLLIPLMIMLCLNAEGQTNHLATGDVVHPIMNNSFWESSETSFHGSALDYEIIFESNDAITFLWDKSEVTLSPDSNNVLQVSHTGTLDKAVVTVFEGVRDLFNICNGLGVDNERKKKLIQEWADAGDICEVVGHIWRGGRPGEAGGVAFLDYHPETWYHTGRVCNECETQSLGEWK